MPYVFPYQDGFVLAIGALIVGLVLVRITLARRRRRAAAEPQSERRDA